MSWCQDHWREVVRDPEAVPLFAAVVAAQRLLESERFQARVEERLGPGEDVPSAEQLNAAKEEVLPVCCYLGDAAVSEIIEAARDAPAHFVELHEQLVRETDDPVHERVDLLHLGGEEE